MTIKRIDEPCDERRTEDVCEQRGASRHRARDNDGGDGSKAHLIELPRRIVILLSHCEGNTNESVKGPTVHQPKSKRAVNQCCSSKHADVLYRDPIPLRLLDEAALDHDEAKDHQ